MVTLSEVIKVSALLAATIVLWIAHATYPHEYLLQGYQTFLAFSILYITFKSIFEKRVVSQIEDSKTRYSFRKTVSILYLALLFLVIIRIWVEETETLIVTYGLVGAGVAVALQDFFKNFTGGIVIFLTKIYSVGDRIEIEDNYGDVIDIGIFYTTLLELRRWIAGDQATGGLTVIPNGFVLSKSIYNYTKDNTFIWDEIEIPITYESDWRLAIETMITLVKEVTIEMITQAEQELSTLRLKYYLLERDVEPAVFVRLTDNWIVLRLRYITDVRQRRAVSNRISQNILLKLESTPNIHIASETLDIVGFPQDNKKNKGNEI
ncbi:MAG: mechanosensitive ion channel family protein [Theionarchaea archaeon]|nr:mechanosensitive ion channel family protein [Theionarchaea archaeon]